MTIVMSTEYSRQGQGCVFFTTRRVSSLKHTKTSKAQLNPSSSSIRSISKKPWVIGAYQWKERKWCFILSPQIMPSRPKTWNFFLSYRLLVALNLLMLSWKKILKLILLDRGLIFFSNWKTPKALMLIHKYLNILGKQITALLKRGTY